MMSATTGAVSPLRRRLAQAVSETAGDGACAIVAAMPARRLDPQRLLAAVTAQREAIGAEPYAGPVTAAALGAACLGLVIEAIDAGQQPLREALRAATIHALGLLEAGAPGRAVEVRVPPFGAVQCVAGPRHTRGRAHGLACCGGERLGPGKRPARGLVRLSSARVGVATAPNASPGLTRLGG